MLRDRIMMGATISSLPAGYTKIEYLESDGNHYIDTGFKPNQDTRVVMDVELNSQSSYPKVLFGARNGSTTSDASFIVWAITANGFRTDFGSESLVTTVAPIGRFVIDKNKNVTSFNGIEYTNPAYTFQCDYNIGLFTQIDVDGPDNRLSAAKLYSCKIYDNDTLVRDFIPCTNPDGISGLWDSVNDVFYKLLPSDYTRLDFIESDGTTYIDTGYKPNNNTRVIFEGYNNSTSSGWIFGAWKAANSQMFCASTLSTYNICYGTKIWANATMPVGPISIDMNKNAYTYNGVSGTLSEQTFSCDYTMYLFHINAAGAVSSGSFNGRIYSVKIYDNGTLVRDFIPAMNASGEAGLYDLKNDVWYALLPVAKPKVANKISTWIEFGDGVRYGVESQYPLASDVTVLYEGGESWAGETYRYVDSKVMSKGIQKTTAWEISRLILGDIPTSEGRTISAIISITPTEDDTYIYTF